MNPRAIAKTKFITPPPPKPIPESYQTQSNQVSPEVKATQQNNFDNIYTAKLAAGASANLGANTATLLESNGIVTKTNNENEESRTQQDLGVEKYGTEENPLSDDEREYLNNIYLQIPNSSPNTDKYMKTLLALRRAGYKNFSPRDIDTFRKMNFKVPLPKAYIAINIINFVTSIIIAIVGFFLTIMGLGVGSFGNAVLPILAFFTGKVVTTLGLALWIFQILTSFLLSIGSVIAQIYYLKSASIIARRCGLLKKWSFNIIVYSSLSLMLGWIIIVGSILAFIRSRQLFLILRSETHKIRDILQKNF